jgi:hypothetical protein
MMPGRRGEAIMMSRSQPALFAVTVALAIAAPLALAAAEQPAMPRLANGTPDLSGVWDRPYVPDMTRSGRNQTGTSELPFSPAGLADWKGYDAANGDYTGSCMPFGFTRSINSPYPMQIVQSANTVALLFEQNTWFHAVPTDGRVHPKEPEPTWFGHSVGRWDGDTLIVDTIGFNGYTRLDTVGHPHSDRLHLVQTFRLTDADHIAYSVAIDDPETFTRPWTNLRTFTRSKGELIEYSCEENNKDLREGHIKAWTLPPPKKKP